MKAYNYLFVSTKDFQEFLDEVELKPEQKVLVRIHSAIHKEAEMQQFVGEIQALLPQAVISGCSTSHVIYEGRIEAKACLISITTFKRCELFCCTPECISPEGVAKPAELLSREVMEAIPEEYQEGQMLLFFPSEYYQARSFAEQISAQRPGIKMIGGKAANIEDGTEPRPGNTYVIGGLQADDRHLSMVYISGEELHLYENVICGAEGASRTYTATKVNGTILEEVDGKNATEWYEGMLDKEELAKEPSLSGVFPLVPEEVPDIAYNVGYVTSDYLFGDGNQEMRLELFLEIEEGTRFSLGYFDPQKIVNQLNETYQKLRKRPVEVLFAYDCLARMWMLHDCAKWEIGQFATTNISGALLSGEISNLNGKNVYANSTFVIAGLSERENARLFLPGKELKNASKLQHENVKMINYLLTTGTKQLNRQIQLQQDKMQRAMFYNETLDLENETKYLFDCGSQNFNKLALFMLDNEELLLLFMGESLFLTELGVQYHIVKQMAQASGIHIYGYESHGILLAADDTVTEDAFAEKVEAIYDRLNTLHYLELTFSYRCALVMNEDKALDKAKLALSYGEKNGKQLVRYSEMTPEVRDAKEELHILQVMRDALLENRVIPYFQGIHDNRKDRITMYEALIRIEDEQGRLYYPNQFLPVAKKYHLYQVLSITMVKKVMELFLNRECMVTINLNVQDIYNREMIKNIFRLLSQAKHPENFIFELVEGEEVKDYEFVKQFAGRIHEQGAKIAIDDFGSGYSNFLHILRIDADILKIDGEIIKNVCQDDKCLEFVTFINDWCIRQKKDVIGEYVENENIQRKLEDVGVVYSQGYYYSKPAPWKEIL